MAELKTKPTLITVESFLGQVADEGVRKDCFLLVELMEKTTSEKATMWGPAIVGFGKYHYRYESGREGDMCAVGFSPRKGNITLYVKGGSPGQDELLSQLGKCKSGKGCVYIKKLEDINTGVLQKMVINTVEYLKSKYPD